MDVIAIQTHTLRNAEVRLTFTGGLDDLVLDLSYECSVCDGHGSPCQRCDSGRIHESHSPDTLEVRLGATYTVFRNRVFSYLR